MRIAVAAEHGPGETRVALVPDLVGRVLVLGAEVVVEPGAGARAGFADDRYVAAGARIDVDAVLDSDVVLSVQPLRLPALGRLRAGAVTISFFAGPDRPERVAALTASGLRAFAMEQVPRISRAQPMDALTSQALVAGYRAVVVAADLYPRFLAKAVTAGGVVPAARVLVIGAGVAGLQAIATARSLGAQVSGYDVRASSVEEIASLGATPVELGLPPLEGAAGYARQMSPERAVEQHRRLAPYVAASDIVITTAAVPGRRAPVLVTSAMLAAMGPGSVVVDIAAEAGGNVEGVSPGEVVRHGPVTLWGGANVPGTMPSMASTLYSQNVVHLLALMVRHGGVAPDLGDEILAGSLVVG
ncbi:MAG: NAD(P) transhydrogenase subunit alpha [Propionibacteriales bacterium]|nr:NAD(P) transhydrogenase subunit alpha [Propionibacteriales bacterium]